VLTEEFVITSIPSVEVIVIVIVVFIEPEM
jgi:hypothetical protein